MRGLPGGSAVLGQLGLRLEQLRLHRGRIPGCVPAFRDTAMKRPIRSSIPVKSILVLLIAMLVKVPAMRAQTAADTTREFVAMRAELEQIKADQQIVKSQLGQILRLLSQRPTQTRAAPTGPVRTSVGDAPALGRADAPVTIVEFSDYQCPSCRRVFAKTMAVIKKDYIDAGESRYGFRD